MTEDVHTISTRSEVIKFVILAIVLFGAVVMVAATRPLIFDRIIPAVLGEGQEPSRVLIPSASGSEGAEEENSVDPASSEETSESEAADSDAAYPAPQTEPETAEDAYPAQEEDLSAEAGGGTPDGEATNTVEYLVQPGDNLTKIAQRYNVAVEAIIAANDLPNPNRIEAGTTILVPVNSEGNR